MDENKLKTDGTRPQQGGEAETTRFGMEDGDNREVPATGGPESWTDEEQEEGSEQAPTSTGSA